MSLKQIQSLFAESIYANDEEILTAIKPNTLDNSQRLQIYKDNVLINLSQNLKVKYEAICKLVDERFFKYAASEYIKTNRPTSGNIDEYGENFADFLRDFKPTSDLKYLPDIARLEWALHTAYFAADANKIDAVALSQVNPEKLGELKFSLHPSAKIIVSNFPIDKIYRMTMENTNENIDITAGGENILVVRPEYKIEMIIIDNAETVFLDALQNGWNLFQAFEVAESKDKTFDVGGALQKFVGNGTFASFTNH
jgi:hypothetical protein